MFDIYIAEDKKSFSLIHLETRHTTPFQVMKYKEIPNPNGLPDIVEDGINENLRAEVDALAGEGFFETLDLE